MPGWVLVITKNLPIYKIRSQLPQWKRARMTLIRADGQRRMTAFVSRTVTRNVTSTIKRRNDASVPRSGHSDEPSKAAKVQSRLTASATSAVAARPRDSIALSGLTSAPNVTYNTATGEPNVTGTLSVAQTERPVSKQLQQATLTISSQSDGPRIALAAPSGHIVTTAAPSGPQLHSSVSPDLDAMAAPSDVSDNDNDSASRLVRQIDSGSAFG